MLSEQETAVFEWNYNSSDTQYLIQQASLLPIHYFGEEIPPGKVLDVGYELGGLVLYYASRGREVHAFDKEPHFETRLKERVANEDYRDKVSFSIGTLPNDPLPHERFAIISMCSVLHFFEFPTAQSLVKRLSDLLIPGGWFITQNHHRSHLYGKNKNILGPTSYYKHFFSQTDINRLFPIGKFETKYISIAKKYRTQKELAACNYQFDLAGLNTPEKRQILSNNYYDVEYHTDIFTVHRKKNLNSRKIAM